MTLIPSRSIRGKLALLVAISVGAAVLLSFAVASVREISRFGDAKRAELNATAEVLAASVAAAVAGGDRREALRALNAIGRMPTVEFAEIRTSAGAIFAQAGIGAGLTRDGVARRDAASLWRMLSDGSLFLSTPVVKGGVTVGSLGILVDTSELGERVRQALMAALLSAAAAILIGFLISARLQLSITRPLGDLASTMHRVRLTSDFTQRAVRKSNDETGELVDSFNDMLDQIRRRDAALAEHRAGLEQTVAARTRELAVARDAAESANRAKTDFLATMSHEIRTPMNGMLVMAELLAGAELPPRQQRYAATIARSGQTLLAVINDILDISKIEAGKLELEQIEVSLATVVDDILGLFSERASSKKLDLAAWIDPDLPSTIEADPVRLNQVLSNLANNALKFTESGQVMIRLERLGPADTEVLEIQFSVEDTGIGIAADKIDGIFQAFSQADQSTTRRFGGTGLGLSISQRLVDAMGGRIWAESELGHGSRFNFTIRTRALSKATATPVECRGRALLAIEGAATRTVLSSALEQAGYVVASGNRWSEGGAVDVIFASPEWIESNRRASRPDQGSPIVVCVEGSGSGRCDRLLADGGAQAALAWPVSSARVRDVLKAVGERDLSSLRAAERAASPKLPDLAGLKVLVADDSPVNREVVQEALARLNARSTVVQDGREAVQILQSTRFDIVLMDCSMPVMDGYAATRAIRAYEAGRGSRTPIIALTAHVAGDSTDSWHAAGMDDHLTKPFTLQSLAECLTRWQSGPERPKQKSAGEIRHGQKLDSAGPLDPGVLASLKSIAGGNGDMLDKIFRVFRAHAPARLDALEEALAAGDLPRAASEAHALKSPSLNIGALRLAALCADIEEAARSGRGNAVLGRSAFNQLKLELDAVMRATERSDPGQSKRSAPGYGSVPRPLLTGS